MSEKKIYWYAVINERKQKRYSNLIDYFYDFDSLVLNIIEKTLPKNIILNDIIDLSPIPIWYSENLCLIGDAAHATTPNLGQGACQAIEDAYIIGKLLENNKDFNYIFNEFQKIRKKKVDYVVNTSWKIGQVSQWEKGNFSRNFFMRLIPESVNQKLVEKTIRLEI